MGVCGFRPFPLALSIWANGRASVDYTDEAWPTIKVVHLLRMDFEIGSLEEVLREKNDLISWPLCYRFKNKEAVCAVPEAVLHEFYEFQLRWHGSEFDLVFKGEGYNNYQRWCCTPSFEHFPLKL